MEQSNPSQKRNPESPNPYPLTDNGNDVYTFISDHGINYGIRFKDGFLPEILEKYGFDISEFEFLAADGKKPVRDERIAATVVNILKDYFDHPLKVVVYICDEEGNKHRGEYRQTLFKDWHKKMGDGFNLYQFSPIIVSRLGSYELYAGIIYRTDCPDSQLLITTIEAVAPDIIRAKYFRNSSELG